MVFEDPNRNSDDGFFGDRNIIPVGLVKSITQL